MAATEEKIKKTQKGGEIEVDSTDSHSSCTGIHGSGGDFSKCPVHFFFRPMFLVPLIIGFVLSNLNPTSRNTISGFGIFSVPEGPLIDIAPGVSFNKIQREWRCNWSEDNDKDSLLIVGIRTMKTYFPIFIIVFPAGNQSFVVLFSAGIDKKN